MVADRGSGGDGIEEALVKRGIVDIRSEEGAPAEGSRVVCGIEAARLSTRYDSGRNLEAGGWIRLLNCASEGCEGVGDFGGACDGDTSLRNVLADEHGELAAAGNFATRVCGEEDGGGHTVVLGLLG
jgi:hypothetical protein